MSYILEALKKSEKDRLQGSVPDLQTLHRVYPGLPGKNRKSRKPWGIFIGFLIGAGGMAAVVILSGRLPYVFQKPQQQLNSSTVESAQNSSRSGVSQQENGADVTVGSRNTTPLAPVVTVRTVKTSVEPRRMSSPDQAVPTTQNRVVKKVKIEPAPIIVESSPDNATVTIEVIPASADVNLPFLEELSTAFQNSIPRLKLVGHTYSSSPKKRLIIINDRIMREGDSIEPGLKLQKITWDGIVLDSNGTSFQMIASQ